jgi:hypothetical protein
MLIKNELDAQGIRLLRVQKRRSLSTARPPESPLTLQERRIFLHRQQRAGPPGNSAVRGSGSRDAA